MRAARGRRRTSELGASWWVLQRVMAFQRLRRRKAPPERRYGASGKTVSPPARNPARATLRVEAGPALDMRAGDEGGFPAPPSAPNQSGRRRGALAVRSRLKRIAVANDRNPRRIGAGAGALGAGGPRSPAAPRHRLRRPVRTRTEGLADNFSLDINFVTGA